MDSSKQTVIGFDQNKAFVITDRIHIAIFGEVGSGKSETMLLLMMQNIKKGEGFMFIDPHGMAARDILSMIPKNRWDDVIYINPSSIYRYSKTVRINPLEVKNSDERYIVAMSFVNALHNLHYDAWGDRLEAILRNACNALVEIEGSTLRDLRMLISDPRMRNIILGKVASKDTVHFWRNIFEKQYSKEAGSAAYNKLDKILATPPVAAMLDTPHSSIDFSKVIDEGKIVIVDLATGASDDIAAFLGSVILHMFYVEATKRIEKQDTLKTPYYLYVDEAHRFSAFALREILNTMRKFNVKVTIATQTINAYPKRVADEISALARTIIVFKCDANTAAAFKGLLPVKPEEIVSMSTRTFAFYSQHTNPVIGVAGTRRLPRPYNWEELAKYSVSKYGEAVSISKYMPATRNPDQYPQIPPCESAVLHILYMANQALDREEIAQAVMKAYRSVDDQTRRLVFESIENLARDRYVERIIEKDEDGVRIRFALTKLAHSTFFPSVAMGRRAGSALHLAAIFFIAKMQRSLLHYTIIDLGESGAKRPDILVFEPQELKDASGRTVYDLNSWTDAPTAIEVETDPTKHESQVVANFEKNKELGYNVWFVVFSQKHKDYIAEVLSKKQITQNDYQILIVDADSVLDAYSKYEAQGEQLSALEATVLAVLANGDVSYERILESVNISAEHLLHVISSLEGKDLVQSGTVTLTKQWVDFGANKSRKSHQEKKYASLTEKGQDLLMVADVDLKKMYAESKDDKLKEELKSRGYKFDRDGNIK